MIAYVFEFGDSSGLGVACGLFGAALMGRNPQRNFCYRSLRSPWHLSIELSAENLIE